MSDPLATEIAELSAAQHGVIAMFQCRAMAPRAALRNELETPRWRPILPSVYLAAAAPVTDLAMVMARVLRSGPGGAVSHVSALALWRIAREGLEPLHVTRVRHTNSKRPRCDGVIPHETRCMPPPHVTVHCGVPVVTPSRALVDVAASEPPGRVERWLDGAWSERLVSYESLRAVLEVLDRPGRRGIRLLAALVEQRGTSYVAPASGLESRINHLLEDARLGRVQRQVDLGSGVWLARVDFRIEGTPVIIEVQSDRYHASLSSRRDDAARRAALESAGFCVVEVWEDAVWHRPAEFLDAVRRRIRPEVR